MTFAARLSEILEDRGLTKSDLARSLGITSQSVGQWDSGVKPTRPRGKRLDDIAKLLDVTASELLADPGEPFRDKGLAKSQVPAPAEPGVGDPVQKDQQAAVVSTWKELPQEDKDLLIGVLNVLRAKRGLPPIAA